MTGLTIILTGPDETRLRAAISLACAAAALGGRARVHFHEHAVALLVGGREGDADERLANGLPDRHTLFAHAREGGIELSACQTGMALQRIDHSALTHDIEATGLVGLLAGLGDDRLVML